MEELEKLKELVTKEIKEVGNKGLSSSNLDSTFKLIDILKDITKIESELMEMKGGHGEHETYGGRYMPPMYPPYMEPPYRDGRRDEYPVPHDGRTGRSYGGKDERMKDKINRVIDGAENYEYGRDRYQRGGSHEAMEEGLEKMMYAVCMLIETAMDAAQTPREKDIIRKHINKIHSV